MRGEHSVHARKTKIGPDHPITVGEIGTTYETVKGGLQKIGEGVQERSVQGERINSPQ
jgi:hypothetical protein